MERVRVGLTGLGLILLLVFIAAAGMRPTRSVTPANSAGETLSVLGVAPGEGAPAHLSANPAPTREPASAR